MDHETCCQGSSAASTGSRRSTRGPIGRRIQDVVVATSSETSSDEDCDAPIENCNLGFNSPANIGNGICSGVFNNAECDWDGGDCCPGDCEGSNCSFYGGDCSDCSNPDSADVAEGGSCYVPPCYGVSITSTGDTYCNEVSWTLNSADGNLLAQGGCNSNICCLLYTSDAADE